MLPGRASTPATALYAARFPTHQAVGFYRGAQSFNVSNLGIGTYLGELDEATDRGYAQAVGSGHVQRDEVVICTKAGYLVPDALGKGVITARDVVGGMHSMAPAFLADQLGRSRQNLGIETIDVFYLHNPETQLSYVDQDEFYARIHQAFMFLEQAVTEGGIQYYGTATWEGYRKPAQSPEALSLDRLAGIAREVAGDGHHFRFIQLPMNLAMPEAFGNRVEGES